MKPLHTFPLLTALVCTSLGASVASADIRPATSACEQGREQTTPSRDFTLLEDGAVVRHDETGLEWRRCPEGMEWTGSRCSGTPLELSWHEAVEYAEEKEGWHLPGIHDLRSIVEECRDLPSINEQVFPNTPAGPFWSSSRDSKHDNQAFRVQFSLGITSNFLKNNSYKVRLVRSAQ